MNIGIIGLGMMGRTHFEAYQQIEGATVVAVADQDPRRAAGDLAGTGGNVLKGGLQTLPMDRIKGATRFEELLAMKEVDIVDVCVPTTQHVDIAVKALAAGKHVLCEKPLARSSADAETIAAAARSAKGFFMPAMCMRFWPQWTWLKEVVEQKRFGAVRSAAFRRVAQMPGGWYHDGKISGGAALDLHIHDTDFVQYLFGMPRAVCSIGYSKITSAIDHLATHYFYDNVPLVSAEGGWVMSDGFGFSMRYTVNFDSATADFDLARPQPLMLSSNGQSAAVECAPGFGYVAELKYFVECAASGKKPTIVTADDAVRSIRIVEAEVESIAKGSKVSL